MHTPLLSAALAGHAHCARLQDPGGDTVNGGHCDTTPPCGQYVLAEQLAHAWVVGLRNCPRVQFSPSARMVAGKKAMISAVQSRYVIIGERRARGYIRIRWVRTLQYVSRAHKRHAVVGVPLLVLVWTAA